MSARHKVLGTALRGLHRSGFHHLAGEKLRGRGVVFMLHNVRPHNCDRQLLAGVNGLCITPQFLGGAIDLVRRLGYDVVALDELAARMSGTGRPFACFTLDDGYRDNLTYAYPVFQEKKAPFAIFVPSDWPRGDGILWWQVLEELVCGRDLLSVDIGTQSHHFACQTRRKKTLALRELQRLFSALDHRERTDSIRGLAAAAGIDPAAICRREIMNWAELTRLARDGLVAIGSHTVSHPELSALDPLALSTELSQSKAEVEDRLSISCRYLSYPYGDAQAVGKREQGAAKRAGYDLAFTTQNRFLFPGDEDRPMALPRVNLDGRIQSLKSLEVILSGLPFAMRDSMKRMSEKLRLSR